MVVRGSGFPVMIILIISIVLIGGFAICTVILNEQKKKRNLAERRKEMFAKFNNFQLGQTIEEAIAEFGRVECVNVVNGDESITKVFVWDFTHLRNEDLTSGCYIRFLFKDGKLTHKEQYGLDK